MNENVQYVPMEYAHSLMGLETKLDIKLIREGCKMCNVPFKGGGITFVDMSYTERSEFDEFKEHMSKQLYTDQDYIVLFEKLDKKHERYVYYTVIAILSKDMLDLKKVLKVHKMKAFI